MENKKIYSLVSKVMGEIAPIKKEKTASVGGGGTYKFRGIDDIYAACYQALVKHSVFVTSEVTDQVRTEKLSKSGGVLHHTILTMRFTFWADDGSSVSTMAVGESMDSGDKSTNKAMSTAYKYAFIQTFCIPTEDLKDSDAENYEVQLKRDKGQVLIPIDESLVLNLISQAETQEQLGKLWGELNGADKQKYKGLFTKKRLELEAGGAND